MRRIDWVAVHHSASDLSTTFRDLFQWHTAPKPHGRGWARIGYHRVIEPDGGTFDATPAQIMGTNVGHNNRHLFGICVIGNNVVEGQHWTSEAEAALEELVWYLSRIHPDARFGGHRDFPRQNTVCPGLDVEQWLYDRDLALPTVRNP